LQHLLKTRNSTTPKRHSRKWYSLWRYNHGLFENWALNKL